KIGRKCSSVEGSRGLGGRGGDSRAGRRCVIEQRGISPVGEARREIVFGLAAEGAEIMRSAARSDDQHALVAQGRERAAEFEVVARAELALQRELQHR